MKKRAKKNETDAEGGGQEEQNKEEYNHIRRQPTHAATWLTRTEWEGKKGEKDGGWDKG